MNLNIKDTVTDNYDIIAAGISGAVVCLAVGVVAAASAHKANRDAMPNAVRLTSNDNGTADVHVWSRSGNNHDWFTNVPIVKE